jgi:peptidoglycan/LPS O-acetylase OafA/YrhL
MKLLFLASWVILLVVSVLIALASVASLYQGYSKTNENISQGYSTVELRQQAGEEAFIALKARRVTAATWALAYALLAIIIVLLPYRRGEQWAWWALLVAVGVSQILSLARAITLMTTAGAIVPAEVLAFVLLGLMAGAPKMFAKKQSNSADL